MMHQTYNSGSRLIKKILTLNISKETRWSESGRIKIDGMMECDLIQIVTVTRKVTLLMIKLFMEVLDDLSMDGYELVCKDRDVFILRTVVDHEEIIERWSEEY